MQCEEATDDYTGSRSPYVVTGYGAGLIMVFRNNVRWGIHLEDDPRRFMTVESGEYVLAIPDYSHQARKDVQNVLPDNDSLASSSTGSPSNAMFKKTVMKLSGNVRWMAGIVFERDVEGGGRSFESVPHYKLSFKAPDHAKAPSGQVRLHLVDHEISTEILFRLTMPFAAFEASISTCLLLLPRLWIATGP